MKHFLVSWNNKFDGYGSYSYHNGAKYTGEWKDGLRHGFGKFEQLDGLKYAGYWANGKEHGAGNLVDKNGIITDGIWKHGELDKNILNFEVKD